MSKLDIAVPVTIIAIFLAAVIAIGLSLSDPKASALSDEDQLLMQNATMMLWMSAAED